MCAIKLKAHIKSDHRLELELPADVPEGEAEVIVLVEETQRVQDREQRRYLEAFFEDLDKTDRPRMTKEEIDRYLEEERVGWER